MSSSVWEIYVWMHWQKKPKLVELRKGAADAEASVLVLGVPLAARSSAAALRLVEGAQGAVFVAVEGNAALHLSFAAHQAPWAVFGWSQGAHGVRHTQEQTVAAEVRDVGVRGLLPDRLRGLRPFLLDVLTLGEGVDLDHFLHLQPIGCLVSGNHPALEG